MTCRLDQMLRLCIVAVAPGRDGLAEFGWTDSSLTIIHTDIAKNVDVAAAVIYWSGRVPR